MGRGPVTDEWEDITDSPSTGGAGDSGEWEDITDQKGGSESSFPAGATLRNLVAVESGRDYGAISGGEYNDDIKYNTVLQNQKRYGNRALGMYQIQAQTAIGTLKKRGIDPGKYVFDEKGQERLFDYLLADRGYGKWLNGEISDRQFAGNISKEWAALPHPDTGKSYYAGVGSNRHLVSIADVENALKNEKAYQEARRTTSQAPSSPERFNAAESYAAHGGRAFSPGSDATPPGFLESMLTEGLRAGVGVNQLLQKVNPFTTEQDRQDLSKSMQMLDYLKKKPQDLQSRAGAFTGNVGIGFAMGQPAKGIVGDALSGALIGGIQPVEGDGNFALGKAQQIGAGATGGMLGGLVARKLISPAATKLSNYIRKAPVAGPEGELMSLSQQHKVPLTYGDITGNPMATKAETFLESMPGPLGIGSMREGQQAAVQTAVGNYSGTMFKKMVNTPWAGLKAVEMQAAKGNKVAQNLLNEINNAGEDWHSIIRASGNLNLFLKKLKADHLFSKAATIAQEKGVVVVPDRTSSTIAQAIKELDGSISPDKNKTIDILNRVLEKIGARPVGYVGPEGELGAGISFTDANRLRSELGEMVRSAYRGDNTLMGTFGASNLSKVRTAITQDMDASALQSSVPGLAEMYGKANRYYLKEIVPYKNSVLAKALDNPNADEIFPKLFKGVKFNRASSNLAALDPKGRAAARYAFISEAVGSAYNPNSGVFSPAKFATAMNNPKAAPVRAALFGGESGRQIVGFTKLIKHAERAGQYMENPPTGNRLVPYVIGGGIVAGAKVSPPGLLATLLSDLVMKGLFTTAEGKRFLLSASSLSSGSPGMQKLLNEIIKSAPKLGGAAISQENQNQ